MVRMAASRLSSLLGCFFFFGCLETTSNAFLLDHVPRHPIRAAFVTSRMMTATTRTSLSAKKKKKAKPRTASSSSGGFGAAIPTKSSSSGISGHSGSGAKVLRKAANNFDRLRAGANDDIQACCRDVYVRSPLNSATTFWFVGKIAREPPPMEETLTDDSEQQQHDYFAQAAVAQKRLILDYSKDQLRPQNLGGKYASTLELWLAPGDSEMDVATNKVNLTPVQGSAADLPSDWDSHAVGFNPEIYVGDEIAKGGLRVERDEHGVPTKAAFDVNQSM